MKLYNVNMFHILAVLNECTGGTTLPSGLSLAQPVDGVEAAVMRSAAVSIIPAIVHLLSEHGLCGVWRLCFHLKHTVLHTKEVVWLS